MKDVAVGAEIARNQVGPDQNKFVPQGNGVLFGITRGIHDFNATTFSCCRYYSALGAQLWRNSSS
jgi:hypothetical protein